MVKTRRSRRIASWASANSRASSSATPDKEYRRMLGAPPLHV
jgi:hypothetical protein